MGIKYLFKCNPKVAAAVGVTSFHRYTWPDGTFLLWENDLIKIDRVRFFLEQAELLADLGAVRMTDPEAAQEQESPSIRLPEARLPEYRWEQPSAEEEKPETEAGDEAQTEGLTEPEADMEKEADSEGGEE